MTHSSTYDYITDGAAAIGSHCICHLFVVFNIVLYFICIVCKKRNLFNKSYVVDDVCINVLEPIWFGGTQAGFLSVLCRRVTLARGSFTDSLFNITFLQFMDRLPDELLLRVFSLLADETWELRQLEIVCRRFHRCVFVLSIGGN